MMNTKQLKEGVMASKKLSVAIGSAQVRSEGRACVKTGTLFDAHVEFEFKQMIS